MPHARLPLPGEEVTLRPPDPPLRGRYRLQFLARGGMSCAYRAVCGQRSYFVKEAAPHQAASLRSEAQMLRRLPLGNFPRFVETFEDDGYHYLVTEFLEGTTLEQEVQRNPWTFPDEAELRRLALDLCEQLQILHSLKPAILYLDLKPGNLIRTRSGRIYLVDFGISRPCVPPITLGDYQGSPQTASPEHFTGQLDRRSDLFCLAATVHYVATRGQAERPLHGPFPPAQSYHPSLSNEFEKWLQKCLSLDPDGRYSDVAEAARALTTPTEKPAERGRSWLRWLGKGH